MDEWQWKPVLCINVNAYVMQTQRTTEYSDFSNAINIQN